MEAIILLLIILTAIVFVIPKKTKVKEKETAPKLTASDEAIEDLILQQVGLAISRLSPAGKTDLIEKIKQLPPREVK